MSIFLPCGKCSNAFFSEYYLLFQAQKPWEKKYKKVLQSKTDYHNACRNEKSTANQENNARADSSMSSDQVLTSVQKLNTLLT